MAGGDPRGGGEPAEAAGRQRRLGIDDTAEENAVVALLGGAVKAALEASVPVELVRRAVDEAIDESNEEDAEAMIGLLGAAGR